MRLGPTRESASSAPNVPATRQAPATRPAAPAGANARRPATPTTPLITRGGGYYLDDGPGDSPPADLDSIPDAVPRLEPLHPGAMKPTSSWGRALLPMTELTTYKKQGIASWYGRRYHGKPTSSGEPYDMYSMSAAHPYAPHPELRTRHQSRDGQVGRGTR